MRASARARALASALFLAALAAAITLAAALMLSACRTAGDTPPEDRLQVVTTTVILADLAKNVGGDLVAVRPIVPPGVEIHSFQSKPEDSIAISKAEVLISNGRGLDAFLDDALQNAQGADAIHVVASAGLEGAPVVEMEFPETHGVEGGQEDEPEHLQGDPHHWQDPMQAIHYVEQIRDGLAQADTANAAVYEANAAAYIQRLRELDQEIAQILKQVPPPRRHLVTFHDAFGYFAGRYGWQVSAFVPHDASDVTPESIIHVIEAIKQDGIPAIFTEPQFLPDVVEQTARDAGMQVGTIYSDTLDDTAPTYIEMMRFNAKSLAQHLK